MKKCNRFSSFFPWRRSFFFPRREKRFCRPSKVPRPRQKRVIGRGGANRLPQQQTPRGTGNNKPQEESYGSPWGSFESTTIADTSDFFRQAKNFPPSETNAGPPVFLPSKTEERERPVSQAGESIRRCPSVFPTEVRSGYRKGTGSPDRSFRRRRCTEHPGSKARR